MTDTTIFDQIVDLAEVQAPSVNSLKSISRMIQEVSDLEGEIARAEELIKELSSKRMDILTKDLPDAMAEAGTTLFVTENGGLQVKVATHVSGSLPKDEALHDAAIKYVDETGGSGIITADVTLKFGRQNAGRAREVVQLYHGRDDCSVELKEEIHHMTLKKWARERLQKNLPVEGEKCGLWIGRMAEIKEVKPSKK